jgi:hypothetical protein
MWLFITSVSSFTGSIPLRRHQFSVGVEVLSFYSQVNDKNQHELGMLHGAAVKQIHIPNKSINKDLALRLRTISAEPAAARI